jgi:hypothetical protein
MTDREKARDLGNQSAALARSIADVLNDTLDALEAAEAERDKALKKWGEAEQAFTDEEAEVARLREAALDYMASCPADPDDFVQDVAAQTLRAALGDTA